MGSITHEGKTILFVSHNMAAVQKLCKTGILLEEGRIAALGEIERVVSEYLRLGLGDCLSWERIDMTQKDTYFERIYFCDDSGNRINQISPAVTGYLVIEYSVINYIKDLKIAVNVKNRYGECLIAFCPEDCRLSTPENPGRYQAKMKFPASSLLFHYYELEFSLYVPQKKSYEQINPIRFSVEEMNCWSYCAEGRGGYLAIPCDWEIKSL